MDSFKDFKRIEDSFEGYVNLTDIGEIRIEFDLEDQLDMETVSVLTSQADLWLAGFNEMILHDLKTAIAAELTDAAYSGSTYHPVSDDYIRLEQSLQLTAIRFYADAETCLVFRSETEYPDMSIYCLLDESYAISDLFVERNE